VRDSFLPTRNTFATNERRPRNARPCSILRRASALDPEFGLAAFFRAHREDVDIVEDLYEHTVDVSAPEALGGWQWRCPTQHTFGRRVLDLEQQS